LDLSTVQFIADEPGELEIIHKTVREHNRVESKPAVSRSEARPWTTQHAYNDASFRFAPLPTWLDPPAPSEVDITSNLTEDVFTGNPLKAMRHKRKKDFQTEDNSTADIISLINKFKRTTKPTKSDLDDLQ
jgi:hypothetical protein